MSTAASPRIASLSLRLIAGALVWLTILLAAGGAILAEAFRDTVEQQFERRLDAMLRSLVASMEIAPDGTPTLVRPLGDPRFEQVFSGWYWQVSYSDAAVARSRSLWDATLPIHGGSGSVQTTHVSGPNGEMLVMAERDLSFPGVPGIVHVAIAGDWREVGAEIDRFDTLLASALGMLGLGMALAVAIQVRFGLRPLRALEGDLAAVRDGARPRLEGQYPREVAPLAEAMNSVLDHDQVLIERARTHVGNLAHALKTPLAVLQAELHDAPDPAVMRAQMRDMARLVEHHLARASAVAGAGRALGTKVAARPVLDGIARVMKRIQPDKALEITVAADDDAAFRGERQDLEEIVGNLAENAAKWARGRVLLSAAGGGGLELVVEDDGPGLSAEDAAEATARGARLDEGSPGWGLGLAIVSDLVAVNGGTISFGHSDLGGLKVIVSFPPVRPPASSATG